MPRLFISHSSQDNAAALAFRKWLVANGWAESDVFIDLHDLRAGAHWRAELRKANTACEAVLLLASPESLDSKECQEELKLADILEKEIIPVIVRDLTIDDPHLSRYKSGEIQVADLRTQPTERLPAVEYNGQVHELSFSSAALAAIRARLDDLGISPGSFPGRPRTNPKALIPASPPSAKTMPAFSSAARRISPAVSPNCGRCANGAPRACSSSRRRPARANELLARGALATAQARRGFRTARHPAPSARAAHRPWIASAAASRRGSNATGARRHRATWRRALMQADRAEAIAIACQVFLAEANGTGDGSAPRRRPRRPPARTRCLPSTRARNCSRPQDKAESERFLETSSRRCSTTCRRMSGTPSSCSPSAPTASNRCCSAGRRWASCSAGAAPCRRSQPTAYRDVIAKPAEIYTKAVRRLAVEPGLTGKLALDATGADALPLLAFTLAKLFEKFSPDGELTLARYEGIGGIGGSSTARLAMPGARPGRRAAKRTCGG